MRSRARLRSTSSRAASAEGTSRAVTGPGNAAGNTRPSIDLTGGNCYWIEIRPTPVGAATIPTNLLWFWRASNQGDGT
ncbi:MAG: hypothetical protein HC774_03000, partial [Sphingomonadales bacterium]|nr:hypothetical protein [Sphingomonadales bacterium]